MSDNQQVLHEVKLTLDGRSITQQQLNEAKTSLPTDKKIIELSSGVYVTKTVLHG